MDEELQRDITFHVYQDFLGYKVNAWDGNIIREIRISLTPMFDPEEGFKEDRALDLKKKVE